MNVLLTSGTGYLGSAIAEALQAAGHGVSALARSEASAQRLAAAGIRPIAGDLTDTAGLRQAATQVDGVIHTAATNDAQMAAVDRAAVEALIEALAGTDKPLIYTSGVWVMGHTGSTVADETWPLNPVDLVAWRPAIEELVLAAAARGVRSQVIRPALVYGRGGGLVALLIGAGQSRGAVPMINDGQNHWPMIHVEDLATLYVRALGQAPAGTVLIGTSGESVSFQAVATAAAAGLGLPVESLTLEEARNLWGDLADALALDQRVSSDQARTLLGWQPQAPTVLEELTQGSYQQQVVAA